MAGRCRGTDASRRPPLLDANERQTHMTLWSRRIASEGVTASKPTSVALTARSTGFMHSPGRNKEARDSAGPSFAHELTACQKGVAFAFGGVDPGTLHAKGRIVSVHTVHYSIGKAGRYKLHVSLRPASAMLPGSPFDLVITPGIAHREMTHLAPGSLPLRGVVGETSNGVELLASDRMGNRCRVGGAPVKVTCHASHMPRTVHCCPKAHRPLPSPLSALCDSCTVCVGCR